MAQTSKCAYRIELKVKSDMTLTELKEIVERIRTKVGAQVTFDLAERALIVVLFPPESLKVAPTGTHEFAAGWIIRGQMEEIRVHINEGYFVFESNHVGWVVGYRDGQKMYHFDPGNGTIPWNLELS